MIKAKRNKKKFMEIEVSGEAADITVESAEIIKRVYDLFNAVSNEMANAYIVTLAATIKDILE